MLKSYVSPPEEEKLFTYSALNLNVISPPPPSLVHPQELEQTEMFANNPIEGPPSLLVVFMGAPLRTLCPGAGLERDFA